MGSEDVFMRLSPKLDQAPESCFGYKKDTSNFRLLVEADCQRWLNDPRGQGLNLRAILEREKNASRRVWLSISPDPDLMGGSQRRNKKEAFEFKVLFMKHHH